MKYDGDKNTPINMTDGEKESIIKAIREAVWLMGLLWNTGGFFSTQDMTAAKRKTAYQAWAGTPKELGPGMQRTLGALYYAALTTLARQAGPTAAVN